MKPPAPHTTIRSFSAGAMTLDAPDSILLNPLLEEQDAHRRSSGIPMTKRGTKNSGVLTSTVARPAAIGGQVAGEGVPARLGWRRSTTLPFRQSAGETSR